MGTNGEKDMFTWVANGEVLKRLRINEENEIVEDSLTKPKMATTD